MARFNTKYAVIGSVVVGGALVGMTLVKWDPGRFAMPGSRPVAATLVVDEPTWDFGLVRQETRVLSHVFRLSNRGINPVRVRPIQIGCNCVSVDCPDIMEPNSTVPIRVVLEVRNREGAFATRVVLGATGSPTVMPVELDLRFYAQPPINVDPPVLQLADIRRGEKLDRELRVMTRLEHGQTAAAKPKIDVYMPGAQCHHQGTVPVAEEEPVPLKRVLHKYRFSFDTSALPMSNPLRYEIRIRMPDQPDSAATVVPVEITFQYHSFLKGQTSLVLERRKAGQKLRLLVWSRDGTPFAITKISSSSPRVHVERASAAPSKFQYVVVSLAPGREAAPNRLLRVPIAIFADHAPKEPYRAEITIVP